MHRVIGELDNPACAISNGTKARCKKARDLVKQERGITDVSRIYDALTIAEDQSVERFTSTPIGYEEPFATANSRRVVLPLEMNTPWKERESIPQLPGKVEVSRNRVRSLLLLAFLTVGGILVGTNYALRTNTTSFVGNKDPFGVSFEGKLRPATEIRITSGSMGTVSEIYVKVGDPVRQGQQLLRMDHDVQQGQQIRKLPRARLRRQRQRSPAEMEHHLSWLRDTQRHQTTSFS